MILIAILFVMCSTAALAENTPDDTGIFGAYEASKEWTPPKDPAVLKRLQEWQNQKLGLLITWGTYSQWGIVESWSLVTTRYPWNKRPPEYTTLDDRAYVKAYENLITTFNPTKFNPDGWAATAKNAGVKYVMVMAKHHDGFCMWDTSTTDYKITSKRSPYHTNRRADVVKEMSAAFRREGLSTGIYFSKADWNRPNYWSPDLGPGSGQGPNFNPHDRPEQWKRFKEFTWKQIEELMTGYGPQDVLWLDGGAVRPPNADIDMNGMAAMARTHQSGLIVVDRTVHGVNENYITPEGVIPDHYLGTMKLSSRTRDAIAWFAQSLIAGDLGPDDSRDGRSAMFLRDPSIVGQAMAIFLYRLEIDETGGVVNHDEAEQRVQQFIRCKMYPDEPPDPPFEDEELGIRQTP